MATLLDLTQRNYLSYSSLTSWLDCGERFRLERVLNAPQGKAWWFIAGDVIHRATELLDKGEAIDPKETFDALWSDAMLKLAEEGVDLSTIKAGGRKTDTYPQKENETYWRAEGPAMVEGWVKWRDQKFSEGWSFLGVNGVPAIEVPVEVEFNDVLVKGYIDRVMVNPNGEVVVVDLKSGSRIPESSLQLGIYSLGLRHNFGITAPLGGYYMTRRNMLTEPSSLLHYTHETVGDWFSAAKRGIEAEVFIPKVSSFCNSCSVAPYCKAVGGDSSALVSRRSS